MNDDLPVPPELQHLLEKRASAARRKKGRRKSRERRLVDLGPIGAMEAGTPLDEIMLEDRRAGERRKQPNRRRRARRVEDGPPDHEKGPA